MVIFFIYLQFEMKKAFSNIVAFVLMIWYFLSVIGFDVHTCGSTGRVFVSPVVTAECSVSGQGGECLCGCCSHCNETEADVPEFSEGSCCSDDYQALAITGGVSSEKHRYFDECSCGLCPAALLSEAGALRNVCFRMLSCRLPDKLLLSPSDYQALISVWLI